MCFKASSLLTEEVRPVLLQGQRYDVLLTANQPIENYWLSALVQYRTGSPAGYAVISYAGKALPLMHSFCASQVQQKSGFPAGYAAVDHAVLSFPDSASIAAQVRLCC